MGLLERAERVRSRGGSASAEPATRGATSVAEPRGLRARADAFRNRDLNKRSGPSGTPPTPGRSAGEPPGRTRETPAASAAGAAVAAASAGSVASSLGHQVQRLGRGLLARAEAFRSGKAAASPALAPLAPDEKASLGQAVGGGLLARARQMREDSDSRESAVAPSIGDEDGSHGQRRGERPSDVGTSADEWRPDEGTFDLPEDEPRVQEVSHTVPDAARTPDLGVNELSGPVPEEVDADFADQEEILIEPLQPESLWESETDQPTETSEPRSAAIDSTDRMDSDDSDWPELPTLEDLELDDDPVGQSAPDEEVVLAPEGRADPFAEWEEEATRAAAAAAAKADEPGDAGAQQPDRYLFAEDEFSTRPVEAHIASQRKIDNYLALFDITKELAATDSVAALWETILYGVMGQVGAETICIFSSIKERNGKQLFPVAHSGFELSESWAFRPGDVIYEKCRKADGVRYAEEFLLEDADTMSDVERSVLEHTGARLVVPLKNLGNMYGLLFLGPQLSGDDYSVDDMEFLALLGETAAVGVDRAMSRRDYEKNTEQLRRKTEQQGRIFDVAREAAGVKNLDELYDLTAQHLRQDFGTESFSVVLLNPRSQEYRLFGGNQISPASIAKFKLPVTSELIGLISNLIRVYELPDFRENRELTGCYTNDDLALMDSYWVVPLISLNWLVGFLTIHKTDKQWGEFERELIVAAAEMLGPVYANAVILGERETLFRDPFSPLEGRLKLEIKKANEFQASVSLIEMRVKNIKRLMAANSAEAVAEFLSEIGRAMSGFLFESDFLARVGQGRFALVLPGRSGPEADIFVKKLKAEFKRRRFLPGSPVEIQFASNIIAFPADADDAGKMLAMLD